MNWHVTGMERGGRLSSLGLLDLAICLALSVHHSGANAFWIANLNLSFRVGNKTVWEVAENGVFAKASPLKKVSGVVVPPEGLHQKACNALASFVKPRNLDPWIALLMRGQCSFTQKISVAAAKGAVGVIIYNHPGTGESVFPMLNFGAEDTVAIMISHPKGSDLVHLIQNGIQVVATIEVGKHRYPWMTHYMGSIFVCVLVAVAYCTFYCAGRLRRARNPIERCTQESDIKKAISQLELRMLKENDKEVGLNGENCPVCLEMYRPKDLARVLHCRHLFHKACVDPWLLKHQTCPVCKWNMLVIMEGGTSDAEAVGWGSPVLHGAPHLVSPPQDEVSQEARAGIQNGARAPTGAE